MKKRTLQFVAWTGLAAIIFVTVSPIGWRPQDILPVNVDRALAFALMAGFFVLAYPKRWATVALLLVAGAGAIEMLQMLTATRHAQVEDAVVKAAGALIGVAAAMGVNVLRARYQQVLSARKPARRVPRIVEEPVDLSMHQLPVTSKAINSVYFDPNDGRLRIRFHNGESRLFAGVSEADAAALVAAPSPGQHYVEHIRKQFPRLAA